MVVCLEFEAGALDRCALTLVPEESPVMTPAVQFLGDADGWRHVAAAVPRDEHDLSQVKRSSCSG
jgi:hypothetical protein